MIREICLYESANVRSLRPLTWLRPAFDLRCGIWTPLERLRRMSPHTRILAHVSPPYQTVTRSRYGLDLLTEGEAPRCFLDAAALLSPESLDVIQVSSSGNHILTAEDRACGVLVDSPEDRSRVLHALEDGQDLLELPFDAIDLPGARLPVYPWDLLRENAPMVEEDAFLWEMTIHSTAQIHPSAVLENSAAIHIGEGARIGPLVVLDASHGPIVIDERAELLPHAVLAGPVYVGPHSKVKYGAKIYEGVSVGPWCKVGGEVEGSVFHSFANKQHEGFIGHSYLGPWVNLGADTNTSDLKNNYSEIRMTCEGVERRTGMMFLGSIFSDHTKTGINTMLNTGSCFGIGCNIFGGDFPPKWLPSFSWGGAGGVETHDLQRFLATAEKVLARRSQVLDPGERELLAHVFLSTEPLRGSAR